MTKTIADIQSSLLPSPKMLTCSPEDMLDAAFAQTKSSHDAVFVFDERKRFLGIVSPSHSLFRKRYAYSTKVKSCLLSPPHITIATPLPQVAEFMVATGIYALPVFRAGGDILGVVTAKNMLRAIADEHEFFSSVVSLVRPEKPTTAPVGTSLRKVYEQLRQKKVSRVFLVGQSGRLDSIVARRDIQFVLTKPSTKQRIKTGGYSKARDYMFGTEKESRLEGAAKDFAKKNVLTGQLPSGKDAIVKQLLKSDKNSVVLVDSNNVPKGVVSTRIVLQALASLKPAVEIPVSVTNSTDIGDMAVSRMEELVYRCAEKLGKRSPIERAELVLKEAKTPAGHVAEFEVALHILFYSGETLFAEGRDRDLTTAVKEAIKRVEKQKRRTKESY